MITAQAYPHKNFMHVVFVYPDQKRMEIDLQGNDPVLLAERAKKMMYFQNREYIIKKLSGWLRQRMYAFKVTDRAKCNQDAAKLIILLSYYENRSFFRLCDLIADHRAAIEALAPSERSSHYAGYKNNILPILEFCKQMKGGLQ